MTHTIASPFHEGESALQQRVGARDRVERLGQRFVRDHLPEEHRQFYARLPWLFVGSVDGYERPWASVLFGRPGFLSSPGPHHLLVRGRPIFGDPLNDHLIVNADLGLLGIELSTRRRNRANGTVSHLEPGSFQVAVAQTFGNCPQYIQAREYALLPDIERLAEPRPVHRFRRFDARARDLISRCDTFFIATSLLSGGPGSSSGVDVSHRGGRPGFVRIDTDTVLTVPDFRGNRFFNTLGNISLNPRAGLLFIDFRNGDLLFTTGAAEIIWNGPEVRAFRGAERLLRFSLDEGLLLERAVPFHWRFIGWSPSLDRTGSWAEVQPRSGSAP
jgi:predicted pyridoxine 5'-phosphate oxidase superfamily flavin-nucleotide-binding protein